MVKIKKINVKAPGKINLHLGVGKSRSDGFHSIQSIFARISLFDDISITMYESDNLEITVNGLESFDIEGEDTLTKAARLWCISAEVKAKIIIKVVKNIPSEAGLGGGSSDAAYVLLALQKLNPEIALPFENLLIIGAEIGSDVPFFLYDETFCYVTGRGEFVEPIKNIIFDYKIHLLKPFDGVSTKGAFSKLDKIDRKDFFSREDFLLLFKNGIESWNNSFINDFELVISSDVLESLKMNNNFCLMSGSGSTCYEICEKTSKLSSVPGDFELNEICDFY
jgi:4-diphosphocytidyl-2-C-methyl-D-erythritol kinase